MNIMYCIAKNETLAKSLYSCIWKVKLWGELSRFSIAFQCINNTGMGKLMNNCQFCQCFLPPTFFAICILISHDHFIIQYPSLATARNDCNHMIMLQH